MLHAIKYVEELEKVGFTKAQAQQSVKIWMEFMDNQFASKTDLKELHFLMKTDLNGLETNMKSEFARVDKEMKSEFARVDFKFVELENNMNARFSKVDLKFVELENRLLLKLGSMMAASVAILVSVITLTK